MIVLLRRTSISLPQESGIGNGLGNTFEVVDNGVLGLSTGVAFEFSPGVAGSCAP